LDYHEAVTETRQQNETLMDRENKAKRAGTAIELQRKGPGRLSNCSEKGWDRYETAAKRAGTAVQLQRKGPGRL
jgi:hypothetical protein